MSFLVRLPLELYERDAFDGFAPGAFSLGTARAAMWLAQLAYEDETDKQDLVLGYWGLRRVASFHRMFSSLLPMRSTDGFVAHGRDTTFIAFQGTDPLQIADWLTDFNFLPNGAGIHQGFGEALDAVGGDIAAALAQAQGRLIVTGHSLGAALAALCAWRLADELGIVADAVYGFGMPRVGTPAFAAAYNARLGERTYRLIHGHDVVPTVPPSKLGFCHVGRHALCEDHGCFTAASLSAEPTDAPPFVESWLRGMRAGLRRLFLRQGLPPPDPNPITNAASLLPPGIADHLPDRYWKALRIEGSSP